MLVLLILVPLFVVVYILLQRRRRKAAARYSGLGFLQNPARRGPGVRRHIPPAIFLTGLAILIFSLARPQAVVALPKQQGTVILAFDVSGSMGATDLTPTRLDAAKAAAKDFVSRQPLGIQIGVVAFSDAGFSVQTPTIDKETIDAAIDRMTPQKGTSIASGIQASLTAIAVGNGAAGPLTNSNRTATPAPTPTPMPQGTFTNAVIVLLTDGENNENPDPMAAAQAAADRGVRIYTVGIGSATGANITISGFTLHTQLDEATLQKMAQISGGTYYNAQSTQQLNDIYGTIDTQMVAKPEKTEITSLFAGLSILVLLVGGIFSLSWFSRLP
jgi:Ca-activated chloride channel family protein